MGLIKTMRRQKAVYWDLATITHDDYGDPETIAGVEIDVRWEEATVEFLDINGTTQLSNAIVYADRDLKVGGVLMLGELTDVTDATNPKENTGAFEIKRFDKLPTLRVTDFLRTAYL